MPLLLRGTKKMEMPSLRLGGVHVGARHHQQVVSDIGAGAPDLLAVQEPAAVDLVAPGFHAAEQVGAAAGFGEAHRSLQFTTGDTGQERLLLGLGAAEVDRLGTGKGRDPPDPAQPRRGAGKLPRKQGLVENGATLATVFLGDTDAMGAEIHQFVPQCMREDMFLLL